MRSAKPQPKKTNLKQGQMQLTDAPFLILSIGYHYVSGGRPSQQKIENKWEKQ